MARKRIGELLVERGAITPKQLEEGLEHHRKTRSRLGVALIQKGFITEGQLVRCLSEALNIPEVDLSSIQPEWSAIHTLRARFCEQHALFPFALDTAKGRKFLQVAMSDPLDFPAVEEIEFTTGLKVSVRLATLSSVRGLIRRYYHKVDAAPADGSSPLQVTHHKAGGGTVQLSSGEDEVIEGEAVETTPLPRITRPPPFTPKEPPKSARPKGSPAESISADLDYLFGVNDGPERVEQLERKFWALLRAMAKKGLITKEEFNEALGEEP
jgi:hypothetical protein